ncbi:hypothetical protein JTM73_32885, partial [Pseudomonas aeruginosa]|nr:hypothetical protein [Pseudomonas aeruginosa]
AQETKTEPSTALFQQPVPVASKRSVLIGGLGLVSNTAELSLSSDAPDNMVAIPDPETPQSQ